MNIQNRDNFFTAGAHAIKKIKYFARAVGSRLCLSCLVPSKLSVLWSQLNSKLYFVMIFYFQQFKYLSNDLEQFYSSSEKIFFRVRQKVRVRSPVSYITAQQQTHITAQQQKQV